MYYNILRIEMQELIQFIFLKHRTGLGRSGPGLTGSCASRDRKGFGCFLGVWEFQGVDFLAAREWQVEDGL